MATRQRHKFHRRSLIWIGLVLMILAIDRLLPDTFWNAVYYKGIYQGLRPLIGLIWGWSPVPMVYLLVGIILFRVIIWWRNRRNGGLFMLSQALGGVAALVCLFYLMWAFNYHQQSLKTVLGVDEDAIREMDIYKEFLQATSELDKAASELPVALTTDEAVKHNSVSDRDLEPLVKAALKELRLPNSGTVRVRQLWPLGSLLHWSTAGIYIPQTGEGHVDAGLLSVQKPFTMAHEMAHGYGVTDEGDCNFVAWLACRQSRDPWTLYSGAYGYWRYAAAEMPRDTVDVMLDSLPDIVTRTLALVRANDKKYKDWMPRFRDAIYSDYLKRHGVVKGLRSYNDVVIMVNHYRKKEGSE